MTSSSPPPRSSSSAAGGLATNGSSDDATRLLLPTMLTGSNSSKRPKDPIAHARQLESRRDAAVSIAFFVACALILVLCKQHLSAAGAVAIAFLGLPVTFFWAAFTVLLVMAVLNIIMAILVVVPLQYFPDISAGTSAKSRKLRLVATAMVMTIFLSAYYGIHALSTFVAVLIWIIAFVLFLIAAFVGELARNFIGRKVLEMLILPATTLMSQQIVTSGGRRVQMQEAFRRCRLRYFHTPQDVEATAPATSASSSSLSSASAAASAAGNSSAHRAPVDTWTNVTVVVRRGVRIDAAVYCSPAQSDAPPSEQRWLMWLLGNGEAFELVLHELRAIGLESGLNVFVFNYRGVGSSEGEVTCTADLVEDAVSCLKYMDERLGAVPEHVVVFGHSIGGAIGTVARACHSPHGPVVVERSFSSLPAAGSALLNMILRDVVGSSIALPSFIVAGLLASIFKGRLDVVEALRGISGSKLVVFHTDDKIIPYHKSSAHLGVKKAGLLSHVDEVQLSDMQAADHHNLPLHSFPEYLQVLRWCRSALGLNPDLPNLPAHVRNTLRSQHTGLA
ncbi:hypothetical protein PTSG_08250 [Salpingoeca rosetta]|uniref:Serine aminopeptidase S33 domain-containing protein n=1 Tax=Salpingoeca rosetta (strain ATCC 50818 / BSB-021) TaxID=946362 RepID=F2UIF6_SALR5|nr:uncharacterized protein PTSG_08250 [Salpingoeca rosetta]EGD76905.1 hypothetical protein PTSG_08250 [Salpingoeca rosetta]|eukprot:XP_004991276.1 hypothetical protein PTSG_08250 [Salpingoeca rosetta]